MTGKVVNLLRDTTSILHESVTASGRLCTHQIGLAWVHRKGWRGTWVIRTFLSCLASSFPPLVALRSHKTLSHVPLAKLRGRRARTLTRPFPVALSPFDWR